MLRGGLLIIHPLPDVTGSAADRSTFFVLNGVTGDGLRAHSNSTSRKVQDANVLELDPVGRIRRFQQKKK